MDPPPKTMKAWVSHRLGSPRTSLTLKPNHPLPSPLPPTSTNLLIHVSHAALNPADLVFLSLLPPSLLPFRRTPIPGLDFSGTVVSAGPDATLSPGTRVCGTLSVRLVATGHGSLAKYVLVPEGLVAKVPEGLGMGEAAGLGVVGQTATLAMRATEGALVDGKEGRRRKVLVNGASGGLGSMIVQLAKAEGARVVGVCSAGNGEFVRGMGADETIDYQKNAPLPTYLAQTHGEEQFDFIFDCVGDQELFGQSSPYLKPDGKFICLSGGKSQGLIPYVKSCLPAFLGGTPRKFTILGLSPSGDLMRQIVKSYEEGKIKTVPIDSEYSMEDVLDAYDRVISKRSKGKVIIRISK